MPDTTRHTLAVKAAMPSSSSHTHASRGALSPAAMARLAGRLRLYHRRARRAQRTTRAELLHAGSSALMGHPTPARTAPSADPRRREPPDPRGALH